MGLGAARTAGIGKGGGGCESNESSESSDDQAESVGAWECAKKVPAKGAGKGAGNGAGKGDGRVLARVLRRALAGALRRASGRRGSKIICSLSSKYGQEKNGRTPTEFCAVRPFNKIEDHSDRMCLRAFIEGQRLKYVYAWPRGGGFMKPNTARTASVCASQFKDHDSENVCAWPCQSTLVLYSLWGTSTPLRAPQIACAI